MDVVGDVATATGTVTKVKSVVDAARDVGIRIVVVLHHRWVDGDYEQWKFPTCVESTARYAMELGYHVTLVTDATAAASPEAMHAAHSVNGRTYAHAIVTAQEPATTVSRSAD